MPKKILIVGGVAGGASAAARLRRLDETAEIILFEKGPHISYSSCALPYSLSDTVPDLPSLILMTPERFHAQHRIDVRTGSEVTDILRAKKKCASVRPAAASMKNRTTRSSSLPARSPSSRPFPAATAPTYSP